MPAASLSDEFIWSNLLHLGYNFWDDRHDSEDVRKHSMGQPYLRCDRDAWRKLVQQSAKAGVNMILVDLGEGVRYASHPELAVKGAWTTKRLKQELAYIRKLGMEPIPKLNFATGHDLWLGPYARCVSTDIYYQVCKDLIQEVIELFDRPRFFHLGMDEETAVNQRWQNYVVIRQHDLWWHDLYALVDHVERENVRAWIWSDSYWHHPAEFIRKMPKTVLQSNWYYGKSFSTRLKYVKAYLDLETQGYDQIPTGSNWAYDDNFFKTVRFGLKNLSPDKLKGFMMTSWMPTLSEEMDRNLKAISLVQESVQWATKT